MAELSADEVLKLVEAARAGDREAFDRLAGAVHQALVGFTKAKIRSANRDEDAQDLAQEVWADVLIAITLTAAEGGYDPAKGRFYTYVINRFVIPKILQFNEREARRRRLQESLDERDEDQEPLQIPDPNKRNRPDWAITAEFLWLRSRAFSELFRLVFLCGGYPHQQLVFGFSKHIYGRQSHRGIEGDPEGVDKKHGAALLSQLTDDYWTAYRKVSDLDPVERSRLQGFLSPLRMRLALEVGELVALSQTLYDNLKRLHHRIVGTTCLRDYYTARGFGMAIPDWCDKVEKRVRAVLGLDVDATGEEIFDEVVEKLLDGPIEPMGCGRCKLRHVSPCNIGSEKQSELP
jgi:DNA-directed RNA polymerase specialized sigma24 family protein